MRVRVIVGTLVVGGLGVGVLAALEVTEDPRLFVVGVIGFVMLGVGAYLCRRWLRR